MRPHCRARWSTFGSAVGLLLATVSASYGDDILLRVRGISPGGLVVARVDLTAAVARSGGGPIRPDLVEATTRDGRALPTQFVPAHDFDAERRAAGTIVTRVPRGTRDGAWLRLRQRTTRSSTSPSPPAWDGIVHTKHVAVTHDAKRMGGLPSSIAFLASGKRFDSLRWNDRLWHRTRDGFLLRNDPTATVERVSAGPLATVVRVRARYLGGEQPSSAPTAVYDWYWLHDDPRVLVTANVRQREPLAWHELHFLELNYPDESFNDWASGEPLRRGAFAGGDRSFHAERWGALVDGSDAIAVLDGGRLIFHDGRGSYGTYLHAHGTAAWQGWRDTHREFAAWLWVGSSPDAVAAVRTATVEIHPIDSAVASTEDVRRCIETALGARASTNDDARWRAALAAKLEAAGRFDAALDALAGGSPPGWTSIAAGDLRVGFGRSDGGIGLESLFDARIGREWLASRSRPIFTLTLRKVGTTEEAKLTASAGWKKVAVERSDSGATLRWIETDDPTWKGIAVTARVKTAATSDAIHWTVDVRNDSDAWALWRLACPQLAIAEPERGGSVLFPRGPGEVASDLWSRSFRYLGRYPDGWAAMQFVAAWDGERQGGLYVATHDPHANRKDIVVAGAPAAPAVEWTFDHPLPDMGKPRTSYRLDGTATWQLFRGDWFDAAVIYRDWVREHASWYPQLGAEGRHDTPAWMRELSVWALGGGAPQSCVNAVKEFKAFLDVPTGFHWYNWHAIPFDNDYPHYFPTKDGFVAGVRELQAAGVFVMPYINGRLWDTRDRKAADFEFSSVARAAATKQESGEPYAESYGSKEEDGSRVKLAPMCAATQLWHEKVRSIVARLQGECGTDAVYIDQVAAASPPLCFDASHGHPIGGGHWWVDGYGEMLRAMRQRMPAGRMLTTECNAEPYMRWFDGYLTWHWQHDGQVPAFPAVYGGAIQMFGRAYRGGATKDLALRMKAAQQLVYGEQIGWINPGVVREKENAAFLRQIVHLRHRLRRYFHAGEMARPPRLVGDIPRVRADWQWSGEWWVHTDAVLTGAWRLPRDGTAVLMFANVGDDAIDATLEFDAADYGLTGGGDVRVQRVDANGAKGEFTIAPSAQRRLTFAPGRAVAWIVRR